MSPLIEERASCSIGVGDSSSAPAPPLSVQKTSKPRRILELVRLEDRIVPAVTWDVNVTADTNTGDPVNHTGSLRYCVEHAAPADVIEFDASLNNQTINLASEIPVSQANLTIYGADLNGDLLNITIDGQANTRLFEILGGANANLLYLTLSGGSSSGNGGAVLVDSGGSFTPCEDTFRNNSAVGNGGAIENDGTTDVQTCAFSNNTAGGNGGAIENTSQLTVETPTSTPGYPTISNFVSDTATGTGGAIDSSGNGAGQVNISNTNFYSNTAANGGAVFTEDEISLSGDTFGAAGQGNQATGSSGNGNGGAVYAMQDLNSDPMSVNYCAFESNQASGSGGAIYTNDGMDMETSNNFDNNSAGVDGGAIESCPIYEPFTPASMGGQPQLKPTSSANTLALAPNGPVLVYGQPITINPPVVIPFHGNTAGGKGGYISSDNNGNGGLDITNIRFYDNSAVNGGGIYTSDKTTLTNDTFGLLNSPNTATANGGAIDAVGALDAMTNAPISVPLTLTTCTLAYNTAGFAGGAIFSQADTYVTNSYFHDNTATVTGGAIGYTNLDAQKALRSTVLYVVDDYFQKNVAKGTNGGAVSALVTAPNTYTTGTTVNDCTFGTNQAVGANKGLGGGVYVNVTTQAGSSAFTDVNDDTFYQNVSDGHGGAVALEMSDPGNTGKNNAYLTSDTVTLNTAPTDSGGVYVNSALKGSVAVDNSILSGNTLTNANGPVDFALFVNGALDNTNKAGVLVDNGYNLVGTTDTMFTNVNNPAATDKPGLGAFGPNGTAVMAGAPGTAVTVDTLLVPNTSPAYRKGDPNLAGGQDERGLTRQQGMVSIGAEDPDAQ